MPHLGGSLAGYFLAKGVPPEIAEAPTAPSGTCFDKCMEGRFSIPAACRFSCGLEEKTRGPIEQVRNLIVIVLGIFLLLIALALITR